MLFFPPTKPYNLPAQRATQEAVVKHYQIDARLENYRGRRTSKSIIYRREGGEENSAFRFWSNVREDKATVGEQLLPRAVSEGNSILHHPALRRHNVGRAPFVYEFNSKSLYIYICHYAALKWFFCCCWVDWKKDERKERRGRWGIKKTATFLCQLVSVCRQPQHDHLLSPSLSIPFSFGSCLSFFFL